MSVFSRLLSPLALSLAWLGVLGSGCGGRTGDDFPFEGSSQGGEGGSPGASGGKGLASGGQPPLSGGGGMTNRGGTAGSGGTILVAGRAGAGGDVTLARCGNGVLEAGEVCDEGRGGAKSCSYGAPACRVCDSSCRWAAGVTSFCGDGKLDAPYETCDDGNTETELCPYGVSSCAVCDAKCQKARGVTSSCGDGKLDAKFGEECDDGNASTELCPYGQTSCAVCGSRCTKVAGVVSYCGDGKLDSTYEGCDPGSLPVQVCPYGQTSCRVCDSTCSVVGGKTSFCGDGIVDSGNGERCDRGAAAKDCTQPCPRQCGVVPNPVLTEALDQWPDSGLLLTAVENATLRGFVFNNQGKADTISLKRLSDGFIVGSLTVSSGSAPALPVDVTWNVDAGQSYALVSSDGRNGRWSLFTAYPTLAFAGIRVDALYTPGGVVENYWFTFTELRSCPR